MCCVVEWDKLACRGMDGTDGPGGKDRMLLGWYGVTNGNRYWISISTMGY